MSTSGKFQVNKLHFKNLVLEEEEQKLKIVNNETNTSIIIDTSQNIDYKEVFNPTLNGIDFLNNSYYTVYNDTVTLFGHAIVNNSFFNKFIMIQLPLVAQAVASGTIQFRDPTDSEISTNIGSIYIDDNLFFIVIKSNLINVDVLARLEIIFTISYIRV
tara:strand:- start:1749 stop:2225 length:477 start_codon:yes stop_codon:yes gene_type:complete